MCCWGTGGDDCLSDLRVHGLRRDDLRTLSANVPISHRKNTIFQKMVSHFFQKMRFPFLLLDLDYP